MVAGLMLDAMAKRVRRRGMINKHWKA